MKNTIKPLKKIIPKFLTSIHTFIDRYLEIKNEFGLTAFETYDIVSLAKTSESGHDSAEKIAVLGHGLNFDQFDSLMNSYPLKEYSYEQIDNMFKLKELNKKLTKELPSSKIEKKKFKI